jgi:hypothetical protein
MSSGLYCSNAGLGCHLIAGATRPQVRFEGPAEVAPGASATYRFVVTSGAPAVQIQAGLDVAASGGTLIVVNGQQEKLLNGEITQTGPKDNDQAGEASWDFIWQAPSTPGEYVLFGAGISVNGDTTPSGDDLPPVSLPVSA